MRTGAGPIPVVAEEASAWRLRKRSDGGKARTKHSRRPRVDLRAAAEGTGRRQHMIICMTALRLTHPGWTSRRRLMTVPTLAAVAGLLPNRT